MTEPSDLYALRDMLDRADDELEYSSAVSLAAHFDDMVGIPDATRLFLRTLSENSVDAADALRRILLPGWTIRVYEMSAALEWSCSIVRFTPPSHVQAVASNECRARLKALVAALIATKEQPR